MATFTCNANDPVRYGDVVTFTASGLSSGTYAVGIRESRSGLVETFDYIIEATRFSGTSATINLAIDDDISEDIRKRMYICAPRADGTLSNSHLYWKLYKYSSGKYSAVDVAGYTIHTDNTETINVVDSLTDSLGLDDVYGGMVQKHSKIIIPAVTVTSAYNTVTNPSFADLSFNGKRYDISNDAEIIPIEAGSSIAWDIIISTFKGHTQELNGTVDVLPYKTPTISDLNVHRYSEVVADEEDSDPTYEPTDDGESVWVGFKATASILNGLNSTKLKIAWDGGEIQRDLASLRSVSDDSYVVDVDANSVTGRGFLKDLEFRAALDYTFTVTVSDDFETATLVDVTPKAGAVLDVEDTGVAVWKLSEGTTEDPLFEVGCNSVFYGNVLKVVNGVRVPLSGSVYDVAASSNAVGAEQMTADLWYDRKHVYRRFIQLEPHTSGTQTQAVADVSTFGENVIVTNLRGMVYGGVGYTGNAYPLPYAHYTAGQEVALYVENGVISTYAYGSSRTWASGFVVVDYVRDEGGQHDETWVTFPTTPATGANAAYTASSVYGTNASYAVWHVFDNNIDTSWVSGSGQQIGAWVRYELPKKLREIEVRVFGRRKTNVAYPQAGVIELSNDGTTWTTGGTFEDWSQTAEGGLLGVVQCTAVDPDQYYKFVRIRITAVGGTQNYVTLGYMQVSGYTQQ